MRKKQPKGYLFIDHETLGIWDSSCILSTGVCYLSDQELTSGVIDGKPFDFPVLMTRSDEWKFDVADQMAKGRTVSQSGIDFWASQPLEVRSQVAMKSDKDLPIANMFLLIDQYLKRFNPDLDISMVRLVDRKSFDISKLQHLYVETLKYGAECPWNYRVTIEISQLLTIFTGDMYGNISPDDFGQGFIYHQAKSDAALDAYRFMKTFVGNASPLTS